MNPNIMNDLLSGRLVNLPMPVMFVLATLAGTTTLGATYFAMGNSPGRSTALLIVGIGLVFVFLLFLAFRALVKWRAKRKANPLAQGIAGNAAATPQGISEPARRARLDDLRRNFDQGVEKFRAAGKNLYSVPWYVVVGEPGSGKTEAIRHCNVGFPPGLQDQLQGAGGTLNMNWWFTNSAIILDTAGRLMFEEVVPGSTNEWNEFLKLLKQNRPNSPLNGMLLVIPVDTLIKDTADAIEKKATRIAQQFDQIQRLLGVRFPVFVIITKCDLLNGFREFFDDLNDPQLQHQIMGWSNPAPLDERFDPAKVTAHLETVKLRLIARRQNLLLDPVNTEDPQSRRVDQVDALYTLPDSVTKIGPRLRRYLEMIFVAGEWSPKPLFLRGIYFTSSMTEGAALDAELAEALGVPVDSLPGGAIFRKDRAYFLRDLFLEKVFREKGLVTRADNADKQQRSRRAMVLGFAFVAVLVLFAVTWFGSRSLQRTLGAERDFWVSAARLNLENISIIDKTSYIGGDPNITVADAPTSLTDLFSNNLERVKKDLEIPLIFRPIAAFSKNVNSSRRIAYRDLYEVTVLRPVFTAARARILALSAAATSPATAVAEPWDPTKYATAIAELMKLEYAVATGKPPAGPDAAHPLAHPQVELAPLLALVLSDEEYKKFTKDNDNLQKVVDWLYTAPAQGDTKWPAPALVNTGAAASGNLTAITRGIEAILGYWSRQSQDDAALADINAVRVSLGEFKAAETELLKLNGLPMANMANYTKFRDDLQAAYARLLKARNQAEKDWALASQGKDTATLVAIYSAEKDSVLVKAQKNYEILLRYTDLGPADATKANASYNALTKIRADLLGAKLKDWKTSANTPALLKELTDLDTNCLATIKDTDGTLRHRFMVQAHLYDMANQALVKKDETVQLPANVSIPDAFAKIVTDSAKTTEDAGSLKILASGPTDVLLQSIALTQFSVDASNRARKYLLASGILAAFPTEDAQWNAAMAKFAKDAPRVNLVRPQVPLVIFPAGQENTFNEQFSPDAAGMVVSRLSAMDQVLVADKDAGTKILSLEVLKKSAVDSRTSFDAYKKAYILYWSDTVTKELDFSVKYKDYKTFTDKISVPTDIAIIAQLKAYEERMTTALKLIGATDEASAVTTLGAQVLPVECSVAFKNWQNLTNDAVAARRSLLSMTGNEFKDGFTVSSANSNTSFRGIYWNSLPVAGLSALVTDGETQINAGITELAKYERFPLASMGDKKDDLSIEDIIAARKALEKILGAAGKTTTMPGGAAGANPINLGGRTNNPQVNPLLDRLLGTKLLGDKAYYYTQLGKFLAVLPTDAKQPFTATFTLNKDKLLALEKAVSISSAYAYMPVSQGGKLLKLINTGSPSALETCNVDYPGLGDLTLGFRERQDDGPIVQTETLSGPWAVLRLLQSDKVTIKEVVGNKWTIEYTVTTPPPNSQKLTLPLILEFKLPIPPDTKKGWPDPKAKAPPA